MLQSPARVEELAKVFIHATKVGCLICGSSMQSCANNRDADGDWILGDVQLKLSLVAVWPGERGSCGIVSVRGWLTADTLCVQAAGNSSSSEKPHCFPTKYFLVPEAPSPFHAFLICLIAALRLLLTRMQGACLQKYFPGATVPSRRSPGP